MSDHAGMRRDPSGFFVRLNQQLIDEYTSTGLWTGRTLADHAREAVAESPEATLIVDAERRWTRAEIYERALRLGGSLRRRGLKPGDVISSQLPNWHEAAIVNLAAALYGFVINPVVPIHRDHEVGFSLAESRSKLLFVPGIFRKFDYVEMMRRICTKLPAPVEVVVVRADAGGFTRFDELLAESAHSDPPSVDPNSVKMVMYTSGTTGRSKGVLHSHNTLMAEIQSFLRYWRVTQDDVIFMPSPVSHIAGTLWALELPWVARASAVLLDVWSADTAVELINRHACTITSGATVFLQDLLNSSRALDTSLPSLRLFVCGGSPIPPAVIEAAYAAWPQCLSIRVYGSTEASSVTYGTLLDRCPEAAANTDGVIRNWDVKICNADGPRHLGRNAQGEIFVRGPELFLGYTREQDTHSSFDSDGYFATGDIGKLVDGDYLLITDRKKDLIIRGGENISAREIEDALSSYPGVLAIAAVAMPSSRMGEVVCVFVQVAEGHTVDKEGIARFMSAKGFARQKIPERVVVIAELPRTASGKILKTVLRERAAALTDPILDAV